MSRKAWDWVKLCKTSGSWDTAPFLSMLENKIFFQSGNFVILVGALFFYIPFHLFHFENKNFNKVYCIKIGILMKFLDIIRWF